MKRSCWGHRLRAFGWAFILAFLASHLAARAILLPRDIDLTFAQYPGPAGDPTAVTKLNLPNGLPPYTDWEPTFASDLHTIYYSTNRALPGDATSSGYHIWRVDSDGSFQLPIAGTAGTDQEWPSISADGNGLAYSSRDAQGVAQIHVLNLASGIDFQITSGAGDKTHPTWAPTGFVAFQDNESGTSRIWIAFPVYDNTSMQSPRGQLTGTGTWDPTSTNTSDTDPAWEPSGARLAFTRTSGGHSRIWLVLNPSMNLLGVTAATGTVQFTNFTAGGTPSDEKNPAWRPEGPRYGGPGSEQLAFASTRKTGSTDPLVVQQGATRVGSTFGIYRSTATGSSESGATVVAEDAQFGLTYNNITPAWSPDTRNDPVTGRPAIANRIVYASSSYGVPPASKTPQPIIPTPYPGPNPPYDLWSSEITDFTPPSLIVPPTVTPQIASPGQIVTITAKLADLNSGVAHVYAQIKDPNSHLQDPRIPALRNSISGQNIGDLFFDGHRIYELTPLLHPYPAPSTTAFDAAYSSYQELGYQPINPVTYSYSDNGENLPLDITTNNGLVFFPTRDFQPTDTIELNRDPSDPTGTTFSVQWKTDTPRDTDYIFDIITVDKADNAIDYDNVGGFSTKSFAAAKGSILLVADYTTPQRFLQPRGGQMPGVEFGVESWLTDNPLAKIGGGANGGTNDPDRATPTPTPQGVFNNVDYLNLVWPEWNGTAPAVPPLPNFLWGFANNLGLGSWVDLHERFALPSLPWPTPTAGGRDAVQTMTSTLTAGQFTLSFSYKGLTYTSTPIQWNDTAANIQAAIGTMPNIGVNGVAVTGGPLNTTPVVITFTGARSSENVGLLVSNNSGVTVAVTVAGATGGWSRAQENQLAGWPAREDSFDPATNYDSYDIWRVLCRGPIPPYVLAAYGPTTVLEPDPTDISKTVTKQVHTHCVIWASPFTADEYVGPGTIIDPNMQAEIEQYLNAGGRMYLTGQDIAWALSLGDPNSNIQSHQFLKNYFGVQFNQDRVLPLGADITSGGGPVGSRWFPDPTEGTGGPDTPLSPLADQGTNDPSVAESEYVHFPNILHFGAHDQDFPDVLTAVNGGATDYSQSGNADAVSTINTASGAKTFFSGFGLEGISDDINDVDWSYPILNPAPTGGMPVPQPVRQWASMNKRPILTHGVVDWMRENSITGQANILEPDGRLSPLPNAIVTAVLDDGSGKVVARSITRADGSFTLSGLPTGNGGGGNFIFGGDLTAMGFDKVMNAPPIAIWRIEGGPDTLIFVTRPGYSQIHEVPHVHGHFGDPVAFTNSGGTGPLNLLVSIAPPGTLTGKVVDASTKKPIAGVTVTVKNVPFTDIKLTATTDANGVWTIQNVPAAPAPPAGQTGSSYVISFSATGYTPLTINTDQTNGGPIYVPSEATVTENVALTPIPVPATLVATAGNATVKLTWGAVTGATGYNLYRSTTNGGPYTLLAGNVQGTSYTDNAVTNGTTYYYVVTALLSGGESLYSNQASATPLATPSKPLNLTAGYSKAAAAIILNWSPAASGTPPVATYTVERSTTSGGPYTVLASNVTGTTYSDASVAGGTTYYYVVTATNIGGTSANSNEASATTPPDAPSPLKAVAGNGRVDLTWTATTGALTYNVKRSDTQGGPYVTIKSGVTGTSYTDLSVVNGGIYYYVVSAVGLGGEGLNSNEVSANPLAPTGAPLGVVAIPGTNKVTITWNVVTGADSYNVKRSTTSGGPYTLVGNTTSNQLTDNSGLTNGTTYYYVVTAVNGAGESGNSSQVSATPVGVPRNLTATATGLTVQLNWLASAGADGYRIERQTGTGAFTEIARVAAGATSYQDTTGIVAHTSYTYRVRATSGPGFSDYSNTANVVTGPDTIEGTISVTFNGTTAPAPNVTVTLLDASGQNVLATTTTDQTGHYEFDNLNDGTYTLKVTSVGQTLTATVTTQAAVNNGTVNKDFSFQPLTIWPKGLSLVSVPFDYTGTGIDAAQVFNMTPGTFGFAGIAGYDPVANNYSLFPNLPGSGRQTRPGQGYWINEAQAQPFLTPGNPVASPFDESLGANWNLIGDPFTVPLSFSNIQIMSPVTVGNIQAGTFITLQQAMNAGIVYTTLWDYANGRYQTATGLQPYVGYWIYVFPQGSTGQGVTIRFTRPTS